MYFTAKGLLPKLTHYVGSLAVAYSVIVIFYNVGRFFFLDENIQSVTWTNLIALVMSFTVILFVSLGITGLFPVIRLTDNGIEFKFFEFLGGRILWDEIEDVVDVMQLKNTKMLVIHRFNKGFIGPKGLLFNLVYGFLINRDKPVLFMRLEHDDLQKVIIAIKNHR